MPGWMKGELGFFLLREQAGVWCMGDPHDLLLSLVSAFADDAIVTTPGQVSGRVNGIGFRRRAELDLEWFQQLHSIVKCVS